LKGELEIDSDRMAEVQAEMATLSSQLGSPKPKRTIMRVALGTLRDIAVSAGGSAAWVAAQPQVVKLIDSALAAL
jgi:hypothetical protein